MRDFLKGIFAQMTPILISALIAGMFALLQSLAVQTGVCPVENTTPQEVGLLGGILKGAHSIFLVLKGKIYA